MRERKWIWCAGHAKAAGAAREWFELLHRHRSQGADDRRNGLNRAPGPCRQHCRRHARHWAMRYERRSVAARRTSHVENAARTVPCRNFVRDERSALSRLSFQAAADFGQGNRCATRLGSCAKAGQPRNCLAVPRGVEPPTFGLGNRCSIRLSYGTVRRDLAQANAPRTRAKPTNSA
jgi:hypothetical protein